MTLILPDKKDAVHKAWMFRLLRALADDAQLASMLVFKGGTYAAMRGLLDRFSVDLDFDYIGGEERMQDTRARLEAVFSDLGFLIKDASKVVPQYFLRYPAPESARNTLKFEATTLACVADTYENVRLDEIDRVFACHTIETMFAHKLVALVDRFEKHGSIAGRDVYDIHHFFLRGFSYSEAVIGERRGVPACEYLTQLRDFVREQVTETILVQDLNPLLTPEHFRRVRKVLKDEVLVFLTDEIARTSA